MRLTPDMIQCVEDIATSGALYNYEIISVRVQDVPFLPGPMSHRSHIWDNGADTGAELEGVSVMRWDSINEAQRHGYYYGDYAAIIVGNSWDYGEDAGEIVIHDPVVIEILA